MLVLTTSSFADEDVVFDKITNEKLDIKCPSGFFKILKDRIRFANSYEFLVKKNNEIQKAQTCQYEIKNIGDENYSSNKFSLEKTVIRSNCTQKSFENIMNQKLVREDKKLTYTISNSDLENNLISRVQCVYWQ